MVPTVEEDRNLKYPVEDRNLKYPVEEQFLAVYIVLLQVEPLRKEGTTATSSTGDLS